MPLYFDLFHLLQESHRITRRLERTANEAVETTERVQRAIDEQATPKRRRGRPLKVKLSRTEAQSQEAEAIDTYDLWRWLLWEVRRSLEPVTPANQFTVPSQSRDTIRAAAALMQELDKADSQPFCQTLLDYLDDILAPLDWLHVGWQPWQTSLHPDDHAFLLWAWRHREALNLPLEDDFPVHLQPAAQVFWTIMSFFHRASSLAEALHSRLRPHLVIHRGMPQWLLPLLQLFWNHHSFQRGKRAGACPLQLAGNSNAPALADAFHSLFSSSPLFQTNSLIC